MMCFSSRFAWLSALLSFAVLSIPITEKPSPARGFTIYQVSNPHFIANGTQHLKVAYAKYQSYGSSSHNNSIAGPTSAPDEVVATPVAADSEYLVPVTINGQDLNMNMDTGSSDLCV